MFLYIMLKTSWVTGIASDRKLVTRLIFSFYFQHSAVLKSATQYKVSQHKIIPAYISYVKIFYFGRIYAYWICGFGKQFSYDVNIKIMYTHIIAKK